MRTAEAAGFECDGGHEVLDAPTAFDVKQYSFGNLDLNSVAAKDSSSTVGCPCMAEA